jgi:preprotein translocase subunit SecF
VWLLGVGTLKDLALVQLVGIIVGTYSSIFFATPLLVSLRERTELVRVHNRRVGRRRGPAPEKETAAEKKQQRADKTPVATDEPQDSSTATVPAPASKPAPGARPVRQSGGRHARPTGKRNR